MTGYLLGMAGSACYGVNPLFAVHLYRSGLGVADVLLYRYLGAVVMMALMMRLWGHSLRIRREELLPLFVMGMLFSLSSLFLFLSYRYLDAGIASTLLFIYPVLVAVLMAMRYHERMSPVTMTAILGAMAGISLLTENADGAMISPLGVLLVFLSSLSYALWIVGASRGRLRQMPADRLTFYSLLFGSAIYVVMTRGMLDVQPLSGTVQWINAAGLALIPTVASLVLTAASIHRIGSTRAAILGALEPVTGVMVGVLVLGEHLTPVNAAGIVITLVSVAAVIETDRVRTVAGAAAGKIGRMVGHRK